LGISAANMVFFSFWFLEQVRPVHVRNMRPFIFNELSAFLYDSCCCGTALFFHELYIVYVSLSAHHGFVSEQVFDGE
jgi:hypothetical protein